MVIDPDRRLFASNKYLNAALVIAAIAGVAGVASVIIAALTSREIK